MRSGLKVRKCNLWSLSSLSIKRAPSWLPALSVWEESFEFCEWQLYGLWLLKGREARLLQSGAGCAHALCPFRNKQGNGVRSRVFRLWCFKGVLMSFLLEVCCIATITCHYCCIFAPVRITDEQHAKCNNSAKQSQQRENRDDFECAPLPPPGRHYSVSGCGAHGSGPVVSSTLPAAVTIHPRSPLPQHICIHRRTVPFGRYCRPDCDKCPKWGARECLFGRRQTSLAYCDLCPQYGKPGCIFGGSSGTTNSVNSARAATSKPCRYFTKFHDNPHIRSVSFKRLFFQWKNACDWLTVWRI